MSSNDKSESISTPGLPNWMKKRVDSRLDFDSAAFTPPAYDDSFFYIRYPANDTSNTTNVNKGLHPISEAMNESSSTSYASASNTSTLVNPGGSIIGKQFMVGNQPAAGQTVHSNVSYSEQCKQYLGLPGKDAIAPPVIGVKGQKKPFGIDDGFNGQRSACSSSIVKVAHQIVNGKSFTRGHTVSNFLSDTTTTEGQHNKDQEGKQQAAAEIGAAEDLKNLREHKSMLRRGSKSLPASPIGSPKAMRKASPNPYFTGTFTAVNNSSDKQNSGGRGWFLTSLLGYQREGTSTNTISSYIPEESEKTANNDNSSNSAASNTTTKHLRAKPSELREMNFWSPTSM